MLGKGKLAWARNVVQGVVRVGQGEVWWSRQKAGVGAAGVVGIRRRVDER